MIADNQEEYTWVGKQLGKYKVIKLLGCGGMGAVYQAAHALLDKIVCLKILFPSLIHPGKKMVERFLREAKAIARLEHPNIVRIYDIEKEKDIYFIVMEFIEGKTLAQLLEERDAFTVAETLKVTQEITEALEAAHRQRIVHRDVKPANIMVDEQGQVKLTDFGLAISMDISGKISGSSELWGTPLYLSPEYIRGENLDHRTDIYSLGVMIYHMLAGEPPYTGRNPISIIHQHLEAPVPLIRHLRPDVPLGLEKIITRAMAKNVEERFYTTDELLKALRKCAVKLARRRNKKTEKYSPLKVNNEATGNFAEIKEETHKEKKIRVLVVDDSQVMCKVISRILREESAFCIVGVAHNGEEALKMTKELDPEVITLDYNMSIMDGSTTLKYIMTRYPRPVIMLSAFTYEGAVTSFDCLSCGAVDFVWKTSKSQRKEFAKELVAKIKNAARLQLVVPKKPRTAKFGVLKPGHNEPIKVARWAVIMGAGEGGYHSYLKIIPYLPGSIPSAVIIVHEMPDELTAAFCNYLNHYSKLIVKQVKDREVLKEGVCYVTNHLSSIQIEEAGNMSFQIVKTINEEECVFCHALSSAAEQFGHRTFGIALTGEMKGAEKALGQVKEVGGKVIVQDPNTCLNASTVKAAIQRQSFDKIVMDVDIPSVLWHLLKKTQKRFKRK